MDPPSLPPTAAAAAAEQPSYSELVAEVARLRARLAALEPSASSSASAAETRAAVPPAATPAALHSSSSLTAPSAASAPASAWSHGLHPRDISRYSRQLLLSELGGADVQARLLRSKALIVGAGGLGCPAAMYLCAAGVGNVTIADGDEVELSNLHRQVLHPESRVGVAKAQSACWALSERNSGCRLTPVRERVDASNVLRLVRGHDVVLDCSDNVSTRYLLNDACIALGVSLVSGSALRLEGQLCVFPSPLHARTHTRAKQSPCYRCLFPVAPPRDTVGSCSDSGVLGAVTGVIGALQAMEAVKLLGGLIAAPEDDASAASAASAAAVMSPAASTSSFLFRPAEDAATLSTLSQRMLLFDGSCCSFRTVRLRPRRPDCAVCGDQPSITLPLLERQGYDYQAFCGQGFCELPASASAASSEQDPIQSATVTEFHAAFASSCPPSAPSRAPPLLLDVREPVQYRICALDGAVSLPLRQLKRDGVPEWLKARLVAPSLEDKQENTTNLPAVRSSTEHPAAPAAAAASSSAASATSPSLSASVASSSPQLPADIYVLCRRGVDSITVTRLLSAEASRLQSLSSAGATAASALPPSAAPAAVRIFNVTGGLQAWTAKVDRSFPLY